MSSASPQPTARSLQRERTRERVYQAALAEMRRAGLAGAQIDRIAAAADVVRGTFYFHFPTREHVLLELLERLENEAVERFDATDPQTGFDERLHALVDVISDTVAGIGDAGLLRDMLSVYVRGPGVAEPRSHPVMTRTVELFDQARQRDQLHSNLGSDRLCLVFLTNVFGFLIVHGDSPDGRREGLSALVDVFLRGVSP